MIKIYRKTATIKAEQFDNSREMAEKYHVEYDGASSILPFRIDTPKGWLGIKVGDWIVADDDGKYWPIADDVFKQSYAELPAIPKNVANYLTDCKRAHTTIGTSLSGNIVLFGHARSHDMIHEILSWLCPSNNQDLFARAWLDGYVVEE